MRLILITGISGAGKSQALRYMEDMGYFCVDNLPPMLLGQFIQMCQSREGMDLVAVGMDMRGGRFFDDMPSALYEMKDAQVNYEIVFVDASDDVLIKRYKETRRSHPLGGKLSLSEAVTEEKERMQGLKDYATYTIDTSMMLPREMKERLTELFGNSEGIRLFRVTVMSFGFKYGIPAEADLLFDVRFIPNPFYIDRLKTHTGRDDDVRDFVMAYDETTAFLDKSFDMLSFLVPYYIREGKNELVVCIGCTGGMHRSVAIADELASRLSEGAKWQVSANHRDMQKEYRRLV